MNKAIPVIIPLLNPNENQAQLVELYVSEKQHVSKGDLICTLETTKSTNDVLADEDGYIQNILAKKGDMVTAGSILCYISPTPDWQIPPDSSHSATIQNKVTNSEENALKRLRISKPALQLAKESGINLEFLPKEAFITKEIVQALIKERNTKNKATDLLESHYPENAVLIYGGGGHGKANIDLLRAIGGFQIAGILDDGIPAGTNIMGVNVLGGSDQLETLKSRSVSLAVNAVGGISNIQTRVDVFTKLSKAGFSFPALIHPTAFTESSSQIAEGAQVFPLAYVGSDAKIGFGNIINTGAIISHDCVIEDYVVISPGAILAGKVHIGQGTLIGMGVTINLNVTVGQHVRIGNGATVKSDVPDNAIIKAGSTWPK